MRIFWLCVLLTVEQLYGIRVRELPWSMRPNPRRWLSRGPRLRHLRENLNTFH
jgi:hypothetical protein